MSIADEKYVSLITFRKNGDRKAVPVWIADLGDGTMGFTTEGSSYKCKRIANNPKIELQACDSRGKVDASAETWRGSATNSTTDFDRVRGHIKKKYGWQVTAITTMQKIGGLIGKGGGSDTAVIITLD